MRDTKHLQAYSTLFGAVHVEVGTTQSAVDSCAGWLANIRPGVYPTPSVMSLEPRFCPARTWTAECSDALRQCPLVSKPLHVVLLAGEAVALDRGQGQSTLEVLRDALEDLQRIHAAPLISPAPHSDAVVHALVGMVCQRLLGIPVEVSRPASAKSARASVGEGKDAGSACDETGATSSMPLSGDGGDSATARAQMLDDARAARAFLMGEVAASLPVVNNSESPTVAAARREPEQEVPSSLDDGDGHPERDGGYDMEVPMTGEGDTGDADDDTNPVQELLVLVILCATGLTQEAAKDIMDSHTLPRLAQFLVAHLLKVSDGVIAALHHDVNSALEAW